MIIRWKMEPEPGKRITPEMIGDSIFSVRDIPDRDSFFHPPHPELLTMASFGYEKEMKKALALLDKLRAKKGRIVVYTDYDADGITGGAILWQTLHLLGFDVMPYVPHRQHEGYGFSKKGIDTVIETLHPDLIISVDHGISARKQIAYALSRGVPVIVTDHHLKPEEGPDKAILIFHVPALSGSGVAYIFASELVRHFESKNGTETPLRRSFRHDYLALAATGTIADLVPLVGASRSIVYHGLKAFRHITHTGLRHLLEEAGIAGKEITPHEVGFMIAPRINALGRLEHALDALRLLCTSDDARATELAAKLGDANSRRQSLLKDSLETAKKIVEEMKGRGPLPALLVLQHASWHEGIIGLLAAKIAERENRPTLVMTKAEHGWKGSGRSAGEFHLTDFLRSFSHLLTGVGGHKGASGFSLPEDAKDEFVKEAIGRAEQTIGTKEFSREIVADYLLPLENANMPLLAYLHKLEPWGMGNPKPVLASFCETVSARTMWKLGNHVKITVKNDSGGLLECVSFYAPEDVKSVRRGNRLLMAYTLDVNEWLGKQKPQAKLVAVTVLPEEQSGGNTDRSRNQPPRYPPR